MNKFIRFLFAITLTLLSAMLVARADGDVTNQTKSLTLRECIDRALENNLEIRSQRIIRPSGPGAS